MPAGAQTLPTITLSGTTSTLPFRDYATRELNDPWDMSQRTDLGWFTWGVDQPETNLVARSIATDAFGNTYFSSRVSPSATVQPTFFLLDTWIPGSARLGKVGVNSPIDTTVYNALYIKMKVANQLLGRTPAFQVYWSRNTIYYDPSSRPGGGTIVAANAGGGSPGVYLTPTTSQPFGSLEGAHWVIYRIPLTIPEMKAWNGSSTLDHWQNVSGGTNSNWGTPGVYADSLRVSPLNPSGADVGEIQVDWARLVSYGAGNATTISWTGGGAYDVVVSTRSDCSDFAVVAYSASSGHQFQPQVLPPGVYRVGLRAPFTSSGQTTPGGNTLVACSVGTITVHAPPTLTVSSPSDEGSTDDFATSFLGNPWDFDALTDIDYSRNVTFPDASFGIVSMAATDAAGTNLGSVRVFRSRSPEGSGDPHIYPLWPIPSPPAPAGTRARGLQTHIDASRYRILTAEVGVERQRDVNLGSIARIVWHVAGDLRSTGTPAEIESQDIVLRHLDPATENAGRIVLDKVQADMADRWSLPVESDTPQSASGWNNTCLSSGSFVCNTSGSTYKPGIDIFRLDFHEFATATNSEVRRIKLAALERTGPAFEIRWTPANPSGLTSTVTLKAVPEANPGAGDYRPADRSCGGTGTITIASGIPLDAASYTWTPAATGGLANGAEYYLCAQITVAGVSEVVDEVMSRWPVVVDTTVGGGVKPTLQLDRTTLRMAAISTGLANPAISSRTQPTTVRFVQNGSGTVNWTASVVNAAGAAVNWLSVSPASGTGSGSVTLTLMENGTFPACTATDGYTAFLRIVSPDIGNSPQVVQVYVTIYPGPGVSTAGCPQGSGVTSRPFGQIDTPTQGATGVVGAVAVTGWVLDDIGVSSVKIYRNCLPFDNPAACRSIDGTSLVYIGDAAFLAGARPDVEAAFWNRPLAYRAGWGYLMLTNMLPNVTAGLQYGGQGSLLIYAVATDVEGHRTMLGRTRADSTPTSISMANASIAKPFGAIDTPGQGQTVSGIMTNFGWVLTPDLNTTAGPGDILMSTDGTTAVVFIDGTPVGHVAYNQCRGAVGNPVPAGLYCDDDVANIFGNPAPQPTFSVRSSNPTLFRNLDAGRGAIGAFQIDTTTLSNGLHTIAWGVTDSAGRVEGIGSRFFNVLNGSADTPAALDQAIVRTVADASAVTTLAIDTAPLLGRSTFDLQQPWETIEPGPDGIRHVRIPELGRLELFLGPDVQSGYLAVNGALRRLPPGSWLEEGRYTWSPPAGYLGEYRLVFVRNGGQIPICVTVTPAGQQARMVAFIDDPVQGASIRGGFRVAGWAADATAWNGSGVGTVHVWARRRGAVETAVFLGAAEMGVERNDVAAAVGKQFARAGWSLAAQPLAPGAYDVTAYFWSTRTGRFEDARSVTIEVR